MLFWGPNSDPTWESGRRHFEVRVEPTWGQVESQKIDFVPPRGRQGPPKIGAIPTNVPRWASNLEPINWLFEAQVGFHFGRVLTALGRHRAFFGRPREPPKPPQKPGLLERFLCSSEYKALFKKSKRPPFLKGVGGDWAPKKKFCGAAGPLRAPPQNTLKNGCLLTIIISICSLGSIKK